METIRPIRALNRGLEALTVLNTRDGATVAEIAQELRLPRTTVYRIVETLCNEGFIARDEGDDRYRLTIHVRALSEGFDERGWVSRIAQPLLEELGREIAWPVSIAAPCGNAMVIRASTAGPLAIERSSPGMRLPLLASAAGRCYLAHCAPAQREPLIEALARSDREEDRLARARSELVRVLEEIRAQGFAATTRRHRIVEETTLSVPLINGSRVLGCLTARFATASLPQRTGVERLLPRLKQYAAKIVTGFEALEAGESPLQAQPIA